MLKLCGVLPEQQAAHELPISTLRTEANVKEFECNDFKSSSQLP